MSNKLAIGIAALALVLSGVAFFHGQSFGGQLIEFGQRQHPDGAYFGKSNQLTISSAGALTLGTSGTSIARLNRGFCNINAAATTIGASSTVTVDCGSGSNGRTALTGVSTGDVCILQPATTTPTTFLGLRLAGVSASSTQGYITAKVINMTGASFTWTAAASTSLQYSCSA